LSQIQNMTLAAAGQAFGRQLITAALKRIEILATA